jgi:arylsulfatase A-like enzyme
MTRPLVLLALIAATSVAMGAVPLAAPAADQAVTAPADQEVPSPPPNILVIVTDDQRVDMMEAMPRTRRLFADKGTTYPNAYATTPLCCPSRASIMTGLYAHNHNVKTQSRAGATLDVGLTMQHYLSSSGYYTGFIGKWLNGWDIKVKPPYLDEAAFFTSSGVVYANGTWNLDGTVIHVAGYSTDFMTKRATSFLTRAEAQDARPWFLMLTPPQPHRPYRPQRRYAQDRFSKWVRDPSVGEEDRSDKPPWIEGTDSSLTRAPRIRTNQMRTLESVDDMVASVFRTMRENGESSTTLAIFTSDNGYLWGEHGILDTKRHPYTPSVHVPLFMRWPGNVAAGNVDSRFAANIDIATTIFEASGNTERATQVDGRSLLQPSSRQKILLEYWEGDTPLDTWASLRTDTYQYIEYYDATGTIVYREYYDLESDPFQLENLLDNGTPLDDPEFITLSNDLAQARECSGPTCP